MRTTSLLMLCISLASTFAYAQDQKAAPKPNQQLMTTIIASSKTAAFLASCTAMAVAGCYLMAKNSHGPLNKINSSLGGAALIALGLAGTMFHEQFAEFCQQTLNRLTQHLATTSTPETSTSPAQTE